MNIQLTSNSAPTMTSTSFRSLLRPLVKDIAEACSSRADDRFLKLARMTLIAGPVDEFVKWSYKCLWSSVLNKILSRDAGVIEYYIDVFKYRATVEEFQYDMEPKDAVTLFYYVGRLESYADELGYLVGLLNYYVERVFENGFDFEAGSKVIVFLHRALSISNTMEKTYERHVKAYAF